MFERYTEKARRAVFFARYEASVFGSPFIDTHHLLLGLLREDKVLASKLPVEAIRKKLEAQFPHREKISTSVDLPLSQDAKRSLAYAAEEAQLLRQAHIDTVHLALGLLRVEMDVVPELLRAHGITAESLRQLAKPPEETPPSPAPAVSAPSLQACVNRLAQLVGTATIPLGSISEPDAERSLAKKHWSRKEALGHLIDWATTHHQWFARALTDSKLAVPGYPEDEWVVRQHYQTYSWLELVQLWNSLQRLLLHVLGSIPEAKVNTPCKIGIKDPVPLSQLIASYVEHCEDVIPQILTHG